MSVFAVSFQKETENSLISAILSGHYFVVCYDDVIITYWAPFVAATRVYVVSADLAVFVGILLFCFINLVLICLV